MAIDFSGKAAIVTGAGGGLGRAHALELARRGAKLVVNDLGGSVDGAGGSSAAAEKVVAEIKEMGGEAIANGSSVTDDKGVSKMVKDAMDAFGRVDILINNAGVLRDKSFAKIEMSDFSFVVDVHLMGTVKPTKAVWPIMKESGYGRILVTTSSTGLYGNFGQTNYGAAKLGVVGLMHTLRLEGAKDDIRVNALAPVAYTRMTSGLMPAEAEGFLQPEKISPGVMHLVSEDAPSGVILSAGAGVFAVARLLESEGVYLGEEPSAESVAEHWGKISDMSGAKPYEMGGAQSQKVIGMAMEGRKKS